MKLLLLFHIFPLHHTQRPKRLAVHIWNVLHTMQQLCVQMIVYQPSPFDLGTQMFVSGFVLFGYFFGLVGLVLQSAGLCDGQWLVGRRFAVVQQPVQMDVASAVHRLWLLWIRCVTRVQTLCPRLFRYELVEHHRVCCMPFRILLYCELIIYIKKIKNKHNAHPPVVIIDIDIDIDIDSVIEIGDWRLREHQDDHKRYFG